MKRHFACSSLLALACLSAAARAAETDPHLSVTIAPGFDSNPRELSDDSLAGPEGGWYTELGLDTGLGIKVNPSLGFMMDLDGVVRSYESDASGADRTWANARAGIRFTPYRNGNRGFAVAAGGVYGMYRSTYLDPATGDTYLMFDGTNDVPVPDRFDYDTTGAFVDLRWIAHERLLIYLDSSMERRHYVESYEPLLPSLDDESISLEPGVLVELSHWLTLDISYAWTDRSYDELAALDPNAAEVPGEERAYRDNGASITLGFEPSKTLQFAIGMSSSARQDLYAGYYDNAGTTAFGSVKFAAGDRTRLNAFVARRDLEYEMATVDNTVNGETLDSARTLIVGRAEHDMNDHFTLFGEAGTDKSENRDPLFTYDRTWAHAGLRFRL